MATRIRLKRIGRRNRPFYRVVVIDSHERRDGAHIEEIGWYNSLEKGNNFLLKEDRVLHWLRLGAIPSNTVKSLIRKAGITFRWHLIQKGLDEKSINHEVQKWLLDRQERIRQKEEEKVKTEEIKEDKEELPAEGTESRQENSGN